MLAFHQPLLLFAGRRVPDDDRDPKPKLFLGCIRIFKQGGHRLLRRCSVPFLQVVYLVSRMPHEREPGIGFGFGDQRCVAHRCDICEALGIQGVQGHIDGIARVGDLALLVLGHQDMLTFVFGEVVIFLELILGVGQAVFHHLQIAQNFITVVERDLPLQRGR